MMFLKARHDAPVHRRRHGARGALAGSNRRRRVPRVAEPAVETLKERFARGKIHKEEFEERRRALGQ